VLCQDLFRPMERPVKSRLSHDGIGRRHRCESAFTLTELLVSSVILALMMILLVGMTDGASRLWRDGERRREASREARAGIRMMAQDLRSAVLLTGCKSLVIEKSADEQGADDRLFFLACHPGEQRFQGGKGDLCATGYFVGTSGKIAEGTGLYRFHAPPTEVLEAIRSGTLRRLYDRASTHGDSAELVARNIVRLEILDVSREQEGAGRRSEDILPTALKITLSAVDGAVARRAGQSLAGHGAVLPAGSIQSYSTVVRLPLPAEQVPAVAP